MINVKELMSDPDFSTHYIIHRTHTKFIEGRQTVVKREMLKYYGPVQPAKEKDLEQLPEGDRKNFVMKFFCKPPKKLYITDNKINGDSEDIIISDILKYDGSYYKILLVKPWKHNGYLRAFATEIEKPKGIDYDGGDNQIDCRNRKSFPRNRIGYSSFGSKEKS